MAMREKVDGIPTVAMPQVDGLTLIQGGAGSGKTRMLGERVRTLVADGADPRGILVVCATPDAAEEFARRLAGTGVRTAYAREVALELLGEPEAVSLFGHGPRVLLPFEEDILFEDLKLCDVGVDRIAGMLGFFKRSMTEISDDHPDFLLDDDERAVMGLLRRGLRLRGAILEHQVCADAARYLARCEAGGRYSHVLVDDFGLMSRSSQVLCALLSRTTLTAAYDPQALDRVYDPYPYPQGADELLAANPQADVVNLGEAAHPAKIVSEVSPDADTEIARVAEVVAAALADGLAPEEVYVASFHDAWTDRVAAALAERGINAATAREVRDLATSDADRSRDGRYLKLLTAAILAANPADDAAWRSWCAFGDPLSASGEMAALSELAASKGFTLHEALQLPEANEVAPQSCLRHREGLELLARVAGLSHADALVALAKSIYGEEACALKDVLNLLASPDPAAAISRGHGWNGSAQTSAVRIGGLERMCGLSPRLVVFCGFVNGFYPGRELFDETLTPPGKYAAAHAAYERRLANALAKAGGAAVFTSFQKIECDLARELGIKIDRIGLERRVRIARVSPSILLEMLPQLSI